MLEVINLNSRCMETQQMASRLTGAVRGKGGASTGKGRVSSKGLFLQTQPLDTSNRSSGGPWPPAQLHQQQRPVCNLALLIKQGHHAVLPHEQPATQPAALTPPTPCFSVCNRKYLNPPTPCIN
ncbi:hypothetical protein PBY51_012634 [Eleginops maclovinus]|uniref:Uncharacterized protein n=1 Tax=Eleginops maclovinus TaxID=56733 RepID=A0AAN7Y4U3_ELEMC|nr:hypothetical protein PBY51_012634 [Eleginops maclovinus]